MENRLLTNKVLPYPIFVSPLQNSTPHTLNSSTPQFLTYKNLYLNPTKAWKP